MVGLSGLEPPTSRLSGVRSNRLSYKPILPFGLSLYQTLLCNLSITGGDMRDRTADPLLAKQVLSQLSYTPISSFLKVLFRTLKIKQRFKRKEVIQPHLPIRLPCYDFTPVANPTFGSVLLAVRLLTSGITGSHGVTGGVYKARERIHRGILIHDY